MVQSAVLQWDSPHEGSSIGQNISRDSKLHTETHIHPLMMMISVWNVLRKTFPLVASAEPDLYQASDLLCPRLGNVPQWKVYDNDKRPLYWSLRTAALLLLWMDSFIPLIELSKWLAWTWGPVSLRGDRGPKCRGALRPPMARYCKV